MKYKSIVFLLFIVSIIIYSCNKENDSQKGDKLKNTIWLLQGVSCDGYYQFKDDGSYLCLNPCYNDSNEIQFLAWTKGAYKTDKNNLTLVTNESCDDSNIGQSFTISYSFASDTLYFGAGDESKKLFKVSSLPSIDSNVDFGYWDFENNGVWVSVESCSMPILGISKDVKNSK